MELLIFSLGHSFRPRLGGYFLASEGWISHFAARREAMFASATRVAVAPLRAVRGPSVRRVSRAVSSDAAAGEKFWDKMTKLASGAKDTETAVFALG